MLFRQEPYESLPSTPILAIAQISFSASMSFEAVRFHLCILRIVEIATTTAYVIFLIHHVRDCHTTPVENYFCFDLMHMAYAWRMRSV